MEARTSRPPGASISHSALQLLSGTDGVACLGVKRRSPPQSDSSSDDTEGYTVDSSDMVDSQRTDRDEKQEKHLTGGSVQLSASQGLDPPIPVLPKKQKKRLENILNRLMTTQDEDKPSAPGAVSELSGQDGEGLDAADKVKITEGSEVVSEPSRRKSRSSYGRKFVSRERDGGCHAKMSDRNRLQNCSDDEAAKDSLRPPCASNFEDDKVAASWAGSACSISFPDAKSLLSHMKQHQNSARFPCGKCSSDFPSIKDLVKHVQLHCSEDNSAAKVTERRSEREEPSPEGHPPQHIATACENGNAGEGESSVDVGVDDATGGVSGSSTARDGGGGFVIPEHHKCSTCRRTFATSSALQVHRCQKGQVRPFGCGRCGRCFSQFSNLKEHASVHNGDMSQELECFECGQKFLSSIELRRHVNVHLKVDQSKGTEAVASSPAISALATVRRTKKGKLRKRFQVVDENQCKVCYKFFPQRGYLQLHMQTHDEKKYSCQYCSKKFTFKKSQEIHIRTHTGEKPYQCDLCPRQFARQDAMQKHRNIHLGIRPYQCDQCGKQFGDSFELRRHINVHKQEKPYKCSLCDKAYSDNSRLKEHMFFHSGKMPHVCGQCGKGFARKYRYNLHMSQHAGETKFTCEVCDKGFLRRSDYNTHKLTHSTDRPFKCQDCGMGFIRENYLKRHELVHSGEKPWTCEVCMKDFKRKNTLKRHMLTHDRKAGAPSKFNRRYKKYPAEFPNSQASSSASSDLPQGEVGPGYLQDIGRALGSLGHGAEGTEERDIMRDIQAVIGVSVASMLNEVV